ncbi:hypothetical protein [Neisseria dentiae]|uniref:hypothetical protein n=1 Tax=Neisseria dentiae TaxID=194197 RepID=UPI0035A07BB5
MLKQTILSFFQTACLKCGSLGRAARKIAAVFLVKTRICGVKTARKMFNLAALFALHLRIFPQKTVSQAFCRYALKNRRSLFRSGIKQ